MEFQETDFDLPLEDFLKLIEGKDVNKLQYKEEPLILSLIDKRRCDIIKTLLEHEKIDITYINGENCYSLHICCCNGLIEVVELLLDKGSDVNVRDKYGNTPLHEACGIKIVELLLNKGADVNAKTNYGVTVLHNACEVGNIEMITFLLDKGANVNAKTKFGATPLLCIPINNMGIVELLLDRGADVNAKYGNGYTVLHKACSILSLDTIELLLQRGAKVEYKNDIPTCIDDENSPEKNEEILELIESYKGRNIKGRR